MRWNIIKFTKWYIESFNIIGFHDTNGKKAESISAKYRLNHYKNFNKLLEECDAVSIVTPTETHFDIGYKCIQSKKHVFIEKPITNSVEDAEKLIQLAKDMSVIIQVGHIERFNPALIPLNDYICLIFFLFYILYFSYHEKPILIKYELTLNSTLVPWARLFVFGSSYSITLIPVLPRKARTFWVRAWSVTNSMSIDLRGCLI